jgi:hydroxyacyl-ACP dehydratase HTD2-like protein with hotdog domain
MAEQVYFEDVEEGMELPVAIKNASRTQLFLYSAATWNPHRIHYDRDYAATEGHPDVLVHGPLQGAWLSQYVTDWIGPAGRMLHLSWQNRGRAFPEQDHTFKGKVIAKRTNQPGNVVELTVWEEHPAGEVLMPGSAVVSLPSRG